jgi:hypothetical protein
MNGPTGYWDLVGPVADTVDIYGSPEKFLRTYARLPTRVGHLLAAHWCWSEVCNGGFHQFFHNSTGVLAPEALAGFRAIGMTEWADLLAQAMARFGTTYPRDRAARAALLPRPVPGQRRRQWDPFDALDDRFFEPREPTWNQAADAYAQGAAP